MGQGSAGEAPALEAMPGVGPHRLTGTAGRHAITSDVSDWPLAASSLGRATSGTYKTSAGQTGDAAIVMPDTATVRFDTKIAVLLRDDLLSWQALNVTAFLCGGLAAESPDLLGEPYVDADGTHYLPTFGQPVLVLEGSKETLVTAHTRAVRRGLAHLAMAIFTVDLFRTGNDTDNRAAVRTVHCGDLDLVGLAMHGPRNPVDKILKGARMHR